MAEIFRSPRLLYRAIESPDDDAFFHAVHGGADSVAGSDHRIFQPRSKKDSDDLRKSFTDRSTIAVIICIPAPSLSSTTPTTTAASSSASTVPTAQPTPIGFISLSKPNSGYEHHRHAMIGVNILAEYQSQGYGTEAIEWVLQWGFEMAGLHRIEIGCFGWNDGARRLYERMGFVTESRQREKLWWKGTWWDLIEMAMLEGEWRGRRDTRLKEKEGSGAS